MTDGNGTIIGSLIGSVTVAVGWVLSGKRSTRRAIEAQAIVAAKQDEREKQCMDLHGEHKSRLDRHDGRFERMHLDFIPRTELEGSMKAIKESADRQERWLEFLVKREVKEPNFEEQKRDGK